MLFNDCRRRHTVSYCNPYYYYCWCCRFIVCIIITIIIIIIIIVRPGSRTIVRVQAAPGLVIARNIYIYICLYKKKKWKKKYKPNTWFKLVSTYIQLYALYKLRPSSSSWYGETATSGGVYLGERTIQGIQKVWTIITMKCIGFRFELFEHPVRVYNTRAILPVAKFCRF